MSKNPLIAFEILSSFKNYQRFPEQSQECIKNEDETSKLPKKKQTKEALNYQTFFWPEELCFFRLLGFLQHFQTFFVRSFASLRDSFGVVPTLAGGFGKARDSSSLLIFSTSCVTCRWMGPWLRFSKTVETKPAGQVGQVLGPNPESGSRVTGE